jgi:hypothetical protein
VNCATHPNVETELGCGRCGKPICPQCLIMTPAGQRCRDCAQLRRPPMYEVKPTTLLRAAGAAVGVGIVAGVIWYFVSGIAFLGFFIFLLAIGLGYAMARAVDLATNSKRGRAIQIIAALGIVLAYFVRNALFGFLITGDLFSVLSLAVAIFMAVSQLR